jgi:lysophospholipase L1-like esterase
MLKRVLSAAALATSLIVNGSFTMPAAGPAAVAAPAPSAVYRIMPLGDSITRGGGQVEGQYIGYRKALQQHLRTGATGFRYDFVGSMSDRGAPDTDHEGHGGWTIDDLARFIDVWMEIYRPDIVLLHAGTNNITVGDSPAVTAAKLRALIARIRSHNPDMLIFVAKVVTSRDPKRRPPTNAYQSRIPGVVAAAGANVHLVDQSSVGGTDIYDYTHPNNFGYAKMGYNWYTGMRAVLGQDTWKAVASPYRARTAYICQLSYGRGGKRVCATRPVRRQPIIQPYSRSTASRRISR